MSAFGGKADIEPLLTNLDLWVHGLPPGGDQNYLYERKPRTVLKSKIGFEMLLILLRERLIWFAPPIKSDAR